MSTSMSAARPTRRAIVHGMAWSVPVVAVTASVPAFAASLGARLTYVDPPVKWGGQGDPKHVSWDLVLTNGLRVIDSVVMTFTYRRANGDAYAGVNFEIYNFTLSANMTPWTSIAVTNGGQVATATNEGNIPAGGVINIHTDFSGSDNSIGTVNASAVITYTTGAPETVSTGFVSFGQAPGGGNSEPAPHNTH